MATLTRVDCAQLLVEWDLTVLTTYRSRRVQTHGWIAPIYGAVHSLTVELQSHDEGLQYFVRQLAQEMFNWFTLPASRMQAPVRSV